MIDRSLLIVAGLLGMGIVLSLLVFAGVEISIASTILLLIGCVLFSRALLFSYELGKEHAVRELTERQSFLTGFSNKEGISQVSVINKERNTQKQQRWNPLEDFS